MATGIVTGNMYFNSVNGNILPHCQVGSPKSQQIHLQKLINGVKVHELWVGGLFSFVICQFILELNNMVVDFRIPYLLGTSFCYQLHTDC